MISKSIGSVFVIVTAFTLATGCVSNVGGQDAGPPGLPKAADFVESCERDARTVIETFSQLPPDMRALDKGQIAKLHVDVELILKRGQRYLKDCREHGQRAKVIYAVAKVMSLNLQRYLMDVQKDYNKRNNGANPPAGYIAQKRDEYLDRVYRLCEEGLLLETDRDAQRDLLKVQGYTLFAGGKGLEAAAVWRRIMSEFPDDPELDKTHTSLISSLLRAANKASRESGNANYAPLVQECDRFLKQFGASSVYYPTIINIKGKSLTEKGDLRASLGFWEANYAMLRDGANGKLPEGAPKLERLRNTMASDFGRVFEPVPFNLGFCHYAMGQPGKALEIWKKYVHDLDEKQAAGKISNVEQVYLGRTRRVVRTLEEIQGKPAPELQVKNWCGGQALDLTAEHGQVVAIFFSPFEQRRSVPFARALERFHQAHWHEGFRAGMICFPKGSREGQLAEVDGWRRSLELTFPVGLDTATRDTHQAFNAAVGSGTIILIDRQNRVAWYKMDPTERDVELAAKVYRRLLGAP